MVHFTFTVRGNHCELCGSRKYPHSPHGRLLEIPRGGGGLKQNILKESMKVYWNFQRGVALKPKNLLRRNYEYFL